MRSISQFRFAVVDPKINRCDRFTFYNDAIETGNVTNDIKVDCVGSTLTLYANGSQLISVEDTAFASGDVGLLAGTFDTPGTDIHFDNFVVRQP